MQMCSRCHKRMAVVFVTKVENNEKTSQGLCLKCAKEVGVPLENFMGNIDLKKIKSYAVSRFKLNSEIHGMQHWERVKRNGLMLAQFDPQVNKRVVVLFAYLHDCEREDDFEDEEHGIRSAEKLYDISETLLADLSEEEFDLLYTADGEDLLYPHGQSQSGSAC